MNAIQMCLSKLENKVVAVGVVQILVLLAYSMHLHVCFIDSMLTPAYPPSVAGQPLTVHAFSRTLN